MIPLDLPVHWDMEMVLASRADVPVLGATRAQVRSTLAARLVRTPEGWVQEQEVCTSQVVDRKGLVKTRLPDAFVDALPTARFPVELTPADGGWRYAADFGLQAIGWTGEGALPREAADPRVVDHEGDGKPGATVLVEAPIAGTGEVWVVQVGRTRAEGRLGDDGAIVGRLSVRGFAQAVIGASSRLLRHGPRVTPDDDASWFRMTPTSRPGCPSPGGAG